MQKLIKITSFLFGLFFYTFLFAQDQGEILFKQICVACHTINQGKLVGPDLANVHLRRSEEWIIKFVQSSQTVIKSGDPVATALFEEFNNIPMPDNNYSADEIRAIIAYIAANSPGGPGAAESGSLKPAPGRPLSEATEENIHAGEKLFMGEIRLTNGGPTCNSCHNVKNDNVVSGGALAMDLTETFTRLNEAGVKAILANPPFPAMKQAFQDKPLSEEEIFDLTAFLREVDNLKNTQAQKDYGAQLFFSGLGGAFVLLILFGGVWVRGKRSSVNQKIYDRQLKSI